MVLATAGVAKLVDLEGSRRAVAAFGVPPRLAGPLGTLLPAAELGTAALLAAGALSSAPARIGGLSALVLLAAFSAGIAASLARGRAPDCHCFGQLHSAPASPWTLARNGALLALAALVASGGEPLPTAVAGATALAMLAVVILRSRAKATERDEPPVAEGLPPGTPAPEFQLPDLAGQVHTLDSLRADGQSILLVFSDANCGPCIELAPEVARWQHEHSQELAIAVIEQDRNGGEALGPDEHGRRNVVRDGSSSVSDLYRVGGTPAAVLVGDDGTIASVPAAGEFEIEALIARSVDGFETRSPAGAQARLSSEPLRRRELLVRTAGTWAVTSFVLAWPARAAVELRRGQKPCPKPWQLRCGERCYSVLIDRDHCGTSCDKLKRCKSGIRRREVCAGGKCIADTDGQFPCNAARPTHHDRRGLGGETPHQCPGNQICCQGNCVDPTRSPNCGACGQSPPGRRPACCQGAPRDLSRDPRHCGRCFNRCPKDMPLCYAPSGTKPSDACRATCGPKLRNCGTKDCFDPKKEVCCEGKIYSKKSGIRSCKGRCVDVKSDDPRNCGDCDQRCSGPFDTGECCNGECCDYNADTCCPGGCKNLGLDDENCGACGNVCRPGEFCRFGECVCPLGQTCG